MIGVVNDWRQQLEEASRTARRLSPDAPAPRGVPFAVTAYYADLVRRQGSDGPLGRMVIPSAEEGAPDPFARRDALHEEADSPAPGLVHRYPDRAVLLATLRCAAYCRFCTRKRVVGSTARTAGAEALEYLRGAVGVRDVLVSGGDPLTMETEALCQWLGALRGIPHIEILRIGTRIPAVLPGRVDRELAERLRVFHPLFINLHFNHPAELTPAAARACGLLADAGIPLGNQTVLLKGVNDDAETLSALFRGLLRMRVKPYYLHQCDCAEGTAHFRVPVERGRDLVRSLQGRLSGLAIPRYVVDPPEGCGKMPLTDLLEASPDGRVYRFTGFDGRRGTYPRDGEAGAANESSA